MLSPLSIRQKIRNTQTMEHVFTKLDEEGKLVVIDMYTGEVVRREGDVSVQQYCYTTLWGDAICEAIRRGHTFKDLSRDSTMPPLGVLYSWRRLHPDFNERLKAAYADRAEYYRDMAVETAELAETREEVNSARLKVETYKWAAAKDDPSRYAENVKVDTNLSGSVGFYALRTGVPHEELTDETDSAKLTEGTTTKDIA